MERRTCINLKCSLSPDQIQDRLQYNPEIVEIQLFEGDVETPDRIVQTVRALKERNIQVYLHHPMTVMGKYLDILSRDADVHTYYRQSCLKLNDICESEDVMCVVHAHYTNCLSGQITMESPEQVRTTSREIRSAIEDVVRSTNNRLLWENSPRGLFSSRNPYWLSEIVRPLNLPLCYDISHAFMALHGDNATLLNDLIEAFGYTRYFHVVDSAGTDVHDALMLGEGGIRWADLKPYIVQRDFIFEIELPDYTDCMPMINSQRYFNSLSDADVN